MKFCDHKFTSKDVHAVKHGYGQYDSKTGEFEFTLEEVK